VVCGNGREQPALAIAVVAARQTSMSDISKQQVEHDRWRIWLSASTSADLSEALANSLPLTSRKVVAWAERYQTHKQA
jgi:hypothetical protein